MSKRLLVALPLLLLPMGVLADSGSAASSIQSSNSAASQLGPQATSSAPSSGNTSGILQPVGGTLQSNGSSGLGGSDNSASSTLQNPGTASQNLQVLSDNADGSSHAPSTPSLWGWAGLVAVLLIVSGGASFLLYRSNRLATDDGDVPVIEPADEASGKNDDGTPDGPDDATDETVVDSDPEAEPGAKD